MQDKNMTTSFFDDSQENNNKICKILNYKIHFSLFFPFFLVYNR